MECGGAGRCGHRPPTEPYRKPMRRGRCPHRPGCTALLVIRRAAGSCCGAQNFCAALRRTLEILTAATRSFHFFRHWRRSIRSPHAAALVRCVIGRRGAVTPPYIRIPIFPLSSFIFSPAPGRSPSPPKTPPRTSPLPTRPRAGSAGTTPSAPRRSTPPTGIPPAPPRRRSSFSAAWPSAPGRSPGWR